MKLSSIAATLCIVSSLSQLPAVALAAQTFPAAPATPPAQAVAKTDLRIDIVSISPKPGSTLKAMQPITVKFKYRYSSPAEEMPVWVKILDNSYESNYQGSSDSLVPGTGTVSRFVYLNEAGKVSTLSIIAKDTAHNRTFRHDIPVNYTYVTDPALEAKKRDGTGSTITDVNFIGGTPATLAVGSEVEADLFYDINTSEGLALSLIPVTTCKMSYEGYWDRQKGKGGIRKSFSVAEPCHIKKVRVLMNNAVEKLVFEKTIDVDFQFVKKP
ncbi:hypothetical protein [Undibacterium pigrum]|uniref:Uncharacterized protein n=1 Tax=Undibacterium pigrum TaxID=401470 RepID=A0A318ILS9_9BURK|nr:hypothetical protein [Undibacterium pigrum]PXX33713.1 hypothetical protein DFR42_1299 [Undibacterium pigrum]